MSENISIIDTRTVVPMDVDDMVCAESANNIDEDETTLAQLLPLMVDTDGALFETTSSGDKVNMPNTTLHPPDCISYIHIHVLI